MCKSPSCCTAASECDSGVCADGGCASPTATDAIKNDSETDVDCGGALLANGQSNPVSDGAPACADAKACVLGSDCLDLVCFNAAITSSTASTNGEPIDCPAGQSCMCQAPSCSDGVENGNETDVDCGGSCSPCAVGLRCVASTDCATNACNYADLCVSAPSCVAQNGGDTCGPGEVGDPGAIHEDCCLAVNVPRPATDGGPFLLDKYLITAGRMRVFLEAVNYDVLSYIQANRPPWWAGSGTSTWDAMLPTSHDDFITKTSTDGSGCVVGMGAGDVGAPAYWEDATDLSNDVDGAPRAFTKDQMDTKVMNCFQAPLFHALCAYDGGRLPSLVEWKAARTSWSATGVATVSEYPWAKDGSSYGTMADFESHAVYDTINTPYPYFWPSFPMGNDDGAFLGAPGRFPSGAGPYGHADLFGCVENMGSQPAPGGMGEVEGDGWFQCSFQEPMQSDHPYGEQIPEFGSGEYRPHWAVGARCLKLP